MREAQEGMKRMSLERFTFFDLGNSSDGDFFGTVWYLCVSV